MSSGSPDLEHPSNITTLSKGAPQGYVLNLLLFMPLTHDCTAKFSSNHIIKFVNDTSVVGLISNNDKTHYREKVALLADWCGANNLSLNVGKTKEVVMNFRRNSVDHPPPTDQSTARLRRVSAALPFYRGTIKSVLTSCITVWYGNCSAADHKTLQRTVNTAAKITGAPLPSILDIFLTRDSLEKQIVL